MTEIIRGIPFDANEVVLPDGSLGYDNVLYSQDFAEWMQTYFKNGVLVPGGAVITTQLQVTQTDLTHIQINTGNMVVNGRTAFLTSPVNMEIAKAGPNMSRFDRIVVELNLESAVNSFRLLLVQGTMSSAPSLPELIRTDKIYQMSIATIKSNQSGIYEIVDDRVEENYCGISQVLIGVRTPLPVTGDTADNISYDNTSTGLEATTVQEAIDVIVEKFSKAGNIKGIKFSNVSVPMSSWTSVSGYETSKFKADVNLPGTTADMTAEVIFSPDDADSGIFSGGCVTNVDSIRLLAKSKPTFDVTIPTIIVSKVVN